nr:maleylpyruvate isomerase family mycothiol-dependent enzyme [Micromonospora provocatoris]
MTSDPLLLTGALAEANDRLLRTVSGLTAADVAAPSLLPGWTRAHVLTHLARNADGFVNLLTSARTARRSRCTPRRRPAPTTSTPAPAAARPTCWTTYAAAASASTRRSRRCPWRPGGATVQTRRGPWPAAMLVWGRLREVEVHHVDLAAGYRPADWPEAFAQRLLHEVVTGLAANPAAPAMVLRFDGAASELVVGDPEGAPTVTGPAPELAAWLTGRGAGELLTVEPDGPLPNPPEWI